MTKSKKFWAGMVLLSLAVMVFAGWSIYGRMALHFSGDTIEVRPVPMPPPSEEEATAEEAAADKQEADKAAEEEKRDKEEEIKAGKAAAAKAAAAPAAENGKPRAVRTTFEYKDASAKSVLVAGSFTSWKEKKMAKKDGVWKTDVYILPGTYPYHFTVDGKQKLDPGKPKAPTGDSLVTVERQN